MPESAHTGTGTGFGRVLVFVYGVFALSATARSTYQLATEADEAPVPYALSAVAAVIYVVATWALATDRRKVALAAVGIELAGVLGVGLASLVWTQEESTVWSSFGSGYGYVPLVLPVVGLWWILRGVSAGSTTSGG